MELATSRRQRVGTGTPLVASIAVHLALVVVIAFLRFDPRNAPSVRLEPDVQVLVDPPVFQPPPPPLGLLGERRPVQRPADGSPEAELRVPIPQKVDVPTAPTAGTAAPSPDRGPGPAIDRALHGLAEHHQAVVVLVDVEGLTYEEAADVIGVPVGTVRSRLFRGRRLLQDLLFEFARDAGFRTAAGASTPSTAQSSSSASTP